MVTIESNIKLLELRATKMALLHWTPLQHLQSEMSKMGTWDIDNLASRFVNKLPQFVAKTEKQMPQ